MRCKKHTSDLTSIIGVCASCLRDRLIKVIVAQEAAENTKSIPPFPTSVSPYITRRKSDTSISHTQKPSNKTRQSNNALPDNQRFFNSPQIAISTTGCIGTTSAKIHHSNKKLTKFATFQNLFRSNNNTSIPVSMTSSTPSSATTTRIKNRHHQQQQQQRCVRNRGMSPVRLSDDDDDDDDDSDDGSSEYESLDTDASCKQTPMKTIRRGGNKSVSEMIFCLSSPLVRANPNRLWKGKPAVDGTGDVRIPVVPKLAYTKSFCANRSRKLADFGRSDPNR